MTYFDGFGAPISNPEICTECGNEEATVTITSGQRVCTDCAEELEPTRPVDYLCRACRAVLTLDLDMVCAACRDAPATDVRAIDPAKVDGQWTSPHRLGGL